MDFGEYCGVLKIEVQAAFGLCVHYAIRLKMKSSKHFLMSDGKNP